MSKLAGDRFSWARWMGIGVLGVAGAVALASACLPVGDALFREHGVLEVVSLAFWVGSCLSGCALAVRSRGQASRLMAAWLGGISLLAALRELDQHLWLNPVNLGSLAVRYRLDWWLSRDVSGWLRLGWAAVFLAVATVVLYPPVKLHRRLWRLFRGGDAFTGLLVSAMGFLMFGFVVDDLLRPVQLMSSDGKQLIEETSEAVGAGLFCISGGLLWRKPVQMRLDQLSPEPAG